MQNLVPYHEVGTLSSYLDRGSILVDLLRRKQNERGESKLKTRRTEPKAVKRKTIRESTTNHIKTNLAKGTDLIDQSIKNTRTSFQ
jgi:hypothetical protein